MSLHRVRIATLFCFVCLAFAVSPQPTLAATYTARTANDLITSIISANNTPIADTIILTADITLTSAADIDPMGNNTGLPPIISNITIEGQGHTITRSGSAPSFRILQVTSTGTLTLYNLTISGGKTTVGSYYTGGGLYNAGVLTLVNSAVSANSAADAGGLYVKSGTVNIYNSTISNNTAANRGGGVILVSGNLNIVDSVISNNEALTDGGGVFAESITLGTTLLIDHSNISGNTAGRYGGGIHYGSSTSTATITNSTFSGNSAKSGGGANLVGNFHLSNSTFSNNTATETGGGAYLGTYYAELVVSNLTFVGNIALQGGGVYVDNLQDLSSPPAAIWDSVIVQSGAGGNCFVLGRAITSNAADLADDGSCAGFTNIANPPQNLNIGTLADNGGSTKTFAISSPSPALDSATFSCTGTDQRGVPRGIDVVGGLNLPQTGDCDVGAFEAGGIIRTLQFGTATSSLDWGITSSIPVNLVLDAPVPANYDPIAAYIWIAGGSAQAGTEYAPFGIQTVIFNPGDQTKAVNINLLSTSLTTDKTIVVSIATTHGPGFRGSVSLGLQSTHIITLKSTPPNATPSRNYFTTKTPTLTWNRVSQAARYEVEIASNDVFSDATKYAAGNGLAITWPVQLSNGVYYWHVRACTDASAASCGAWSTPDSFVVSVP